MKLGLISPVPNDATSFYRAYGVFSWLARQAENVQLITGDKWSWETVMQCDLLVMQRPWVEPHRIVCEMAKRMGVPLILDYDDNLFAIHRSNPAYGTFMQPVVQKDLKHMGNLADVVITTTKSLGTIYQRSIVIPNAFNDYLWEFQMGPRNKVITWRGGISHFGDMEPFLPAMKKVAVNHPGWDWHFFGEPHWGVEQIVAPDQYHRHGFIDVFGYMHNYAAAKPWVHIVPLLETTFNMCKSNIAWIEATYAGAMTVAPKWEEFDKPGVLTYSNPQEFEEQLAKALAMKPAEQNERVDASRQYIKEHLLLSIVNKQRIDLLNKLYSREPVFT